MSGAGTPRYTAPEVFFYQPYNLKADVYSFSVMLEDALPGEFEETTSPFRRTAVTL